MQLHVRAFAVCTFLAAGFATAGFADESLKETVSTRMDQAANEFKSMTAHVTYVTHTEVLNEDSTETGNMIMKKVQPGEVQVRIDFTAPDVKTVTCGHTALSGYIIPRSKLCRSTTWPNMANSLTSS